MKEGEVKEEKMINESKVESILKDTDKLYVKSE